MIIADWFCMKGVGPVSSGLDTRDIIEELKRIRKASEKSITAQGLTEEVGSWRRVPTYEDLRQTELETNEDIAKKLTQSLTSKKINII